VKKEDEVIHVAPVAAGDHVACATVQGKALICSVEEVPVLAGPGSGVMLIKLGKGDAVIGGAVLHDRDDHLVVRRLGGAEYRVSMRKYEVVSRGGKGRPLFHRGQVEAVVLQEPTLPGFPAPEGDG
jgi:DNA gyrase subunit A